MKNRGKNKKKQWNRIMKNISSELHDAAKRDEISEAGFVIQKKAEKNIIKGDKDAAKDYQDIPTASSVTERKFYRPGKRSISVRCIDLWNEETKTANDSKKPVKTPQDLTNPPELICPAGQSYNPSAVDHRVLLLHVAKEEMKAEAMVNPNSAMIHKEKKKKRTKLTQAQLELLHLKAKSKAGKPTAKQLAKQMHTDLDNIPKLLKEIRKEGRQQEARRQWRRFMTTVRKHEKTPKFPTSFQLPGELPTALRKLHADEHWIREVEFKRNKLPRARKTLDRKAEVKTFERRSRMN